VSAKDGEPPPPGATPDSRTEERVTLCGTCGGVVGWFATFCEACGARVRRSEAAGADATPAVAREGAADAPVFDVRLAAKDLFRAQMRLMHRTAEQAERLLADAREARGDLAAARRAPRSDERRVRLQRVSERLMDAEAAWEELQRTFNRESEASEEDWRTFSEGAQVDAYLSPAEEEAVATEFAALQLKFEAAEAEVREAGRDLAVARREAESRLFGRPAASGGVFVACAVLAGAALATSAYRIYGALPPREATIAFVPAVCGALLFALLALRRA